MSKLMVNSVMASFEYQTDNFKSTSNNDESEKARSPSPDWGAGLLALLALHGRAPAASSF